MIGYDSLYAKDNFNYTRPWGADFTPYLMMGVNASYPMTDKLTGTLYVVNGYWHLADANRVPSSGGQIAYKATPKLTLKETVLWGPHQPNTALEFWRFLSDTVIERRTERVVVALNAHFATEDRRCAGTSPRMVDGRTAADPVDDSARVECRRPAGDCMGFCRPLDARRADRQGDHQHSRLPHASTVGERADASWNIASTNRGDLAVGFFDVDPMRPGPEVSSGDSSC